MGDVEQLLRDYGRDADEVVRPVSMDDLGSRPVSLVDRPPAAFARAWRRPELATVAACVALAVGLGFVLGRMSAPEGSEERPPAESTVIDPFVTLPEPAPTVPADPIDEVMETSIGSISWTRVEGDPELMPRRVVGRDGETLIGEGWDPSVSWSSTDGGVSWQRSQTDGVRGRAGGYEWVIRDREDGQSGLSRVTADGEIHVAVDPAIGDAPDGWKVSTHHTIPVDIGREAFVLTSTYVRADLEAVASELGVTRLMFPGGAIRSFGEERGAGGFSSESELRLVPATQPGSRMVDLVDPAGEVVATFDAAIGLFDDVDPAALVTEGRATSQWAVFDGDRFVALDTPWPVSTNTTMVSVGDSVMVVASGLWGPMIESHRTSVWTTTDGRTWVDVTPGDPDAVPTWLTDVTETDDAVIIGLAESWFITRDGHIFEPLSPRPRTGQRSRSDVGWVAMQPGEFTLWVSPDGDDWETHRIHDLHGLGYTSASTWGQINVIDSTIYIVVNSGRDDGRGVLLVGEIAPTQ